MTVMTIDTTTEAERSELAECASAANGSHSEVSSILSGVLPAAIAAGKALLRARAIVDQMPSLTWQRWCADNVLASLDMAQRYMRVAYYSADLEEKIASGDIRTLEEATGILVGRPAFHDKVSKPEAMKAEARALVKSGMSIRAVGSLLGVHNTTVLHWVNREAARQDNRRIEQIRRRNKEALKLLKKQEEAALARAAGGTVSTAYGLIRKAALEIDAAACESTSVDERAHLKMALSRIHRAEDAIVAALRARA